MGEKDTIGWTAARCPPKDEFCANKRPGSMGSFEQGFSRWIVARQIGFPVSIATPKLGPENVRVSWSRASFHWPTATRQSAWGMHSIVR